MSSENEKEPTQEKQGEPIDGMLMSIVPPQQTKENTIEKEEKKEKEEKATLEISELPTTIPNKREKPKVVEQIPINPVPEKPQKLSEYELINRDPPLKHYEWAIKRRMDHFYGELAHITDNEYSLLDFAHSYKKMGVHVLENNDIVYREYAPGAFSVTIFGDFNNWNRDEFQLVKDSFGFWEITLKNVNGQPRIPHNSRIKAGVTLAFGRKEVRNPIWSTYMRQNHDTYVFDSIFWNPPEKFVWTTPDHVKRPKSLRIYEAHVGMSSFDLKMSSYREFADTIIPRIIKTGYTAIQLMAIMEHANYSSFGYHVSNFFAISSWFGNPEDLKYLINKAHENGLMVLIDIVHSHASKNVDDGISCWDGTDYLLFHSGSRGNHDLWDSRLFNYNNFETLRFLLSNCAFYLEEYHFDGFRFDGVTSILYKHHGICYGFTGYLGQYYEDLVDEDGEVYLMLANHLIHMINPEAVTIAEDVSGMPGIARPIKDAGFGFDFRLNMSIPDKWIKLLREEKDEYWNMGNITYTLTNRRHDEGHVAYAESHDQSIVGDKTISMWLFDREIYWNMSLNSPETQVIHRGFALHKMIRLITMALGGEAYLNFMGNEFGHPEWVDFPRPGNGFSYHHCRRRWDLCDADYLRYKYLYNFDVAMNSLDDVFEIINNKTQFVSLAHEDDKIIVFEKADLLFIFNFHPYKSFDHYKVGTRWNSDHKIVLDSDEARFFGHSRLTYGHDNSFPTFHEPWHMRENYFKLYIPSRTCMVLLAEENRAKYDLTKLK